MEEFNSVTRTSCRLFSTIYEDADAIVRPPFLCMKGTLKSVAGFDDIHVDAETVRSVYACVGDVMDTKAGVGVRDWIDDDPGGGGDLNRTAEVLIAVVVSTEKSQAHPGVDGHESIPAAQSETRHNGRHHSVFACCCQ